MPKIFLALPFAVVMWLTGIFVSPVRGATTDPISATVSATATVPSTTASPTDTQSPTPPILIAPADGTHSGDNTPEFVWRASTDPDGNTLHYTLYLNGVATFLGISNLGNSSGTGYTSRIDGTEVRLIPTNSLPDGSYTWYVTASDPSGHTSQSTTWSFIVDTTPPPLIVIDIDDYHLPDVSGGANFDISGPKNVSLTLKSDPFVDIHLTLTDQSSNIARLKTTANSIGLAYFNPHLEVGVYTVTILAVDRAGNPTLLPDFTLTITQAEITITLPPISTTPLITIPYTPINLPSLPSTIAQLQTRSALPSLLVLLLAIILLILLIIVWRKRYNLLLVDDHGDPLAEAIIYHSRPPSRQRHLLHNLFRNNDSILYRLTLSQSGRLYISGLKKYSTLTIRHANHTMVLSICVDADRYTVIVSQ